MSTDKLFNGGHEFFTKEDCPRCGDEKDNDCYLWCLKCVKELRRSRRKKKVKREEAEK